MPFTLRFVREIGFGTLAAVDLPQGEGHPIPLVSEEAIYVASLPPARRVTWVGGRVALHAALEGAGAARSGAHAILATGRGAPAMPDGFVGSVSHKPTCAVALVARADPRAPVTVGIDLEIPRPLRYDIAPRVLRPEEQVELETLPSNALREREVLRRFAAKEAIYKALDPWVHRFISFQEVSIRGDVAGRLEAHLHLTTGEGPFTVELESDDEDGEMILVVARVRSLPGGAPLTR